MAKKSSTSKSSSPRKAPWKKSNPRKTSGKASKHLTPAKKAEAKRSAKKAGRPYPNLVDNMKVAKKKTSKKTSKKAVKKTTTKKTVKKKSAKKSKKKASSASARKAEKDPKGGLTAAGRRAFAKKDGSHLKPGVMKSDADMSPSDMKRKGSWAVRFYGRKELPPLIDKNGEPTRHALSAHAWGEPVPKTVAAARRIAAKGERLLEKYHKLKGA